MKILGYIFLFLSVIILSHRAQAQPGCIGFNADFSFQIDTSPDFYPNQVTFKNTSIWTDSTTKFRWKYDDGSFASIKEDTHIFPSIGQYTVCLYAVNITPSGDTTCRDSVCYIVSTNLDSCIINGDFTFTVDSADCQKYLFKPVNPNYDVYQWNLGDSVNYLGATQTKKYMAQGNYNICLKASFTYANHTKECRDSVCRQITVCNSLSVSLLDDNPNITIYPVPFDDYFVLSGLPADKTVKVYVFDLLGKTVIAEWINNSNVINTGNLPKGFYTVEITDETTVLQRQKVVK